MANDLDLTPEDLAGLPGAPFTQDQVDTALATLRLAAGWHIAPVVTDTVDFDIRPHWPYIQLPTLKLLTITSVADTDDDTVIDASEYRVSHKLASIERNCRPWCEGYERVTVVFEHGYETLPTELLTVLADAARMARRDQGVQSVSIDDFRQSFGTSASLAANPMSTSAILAHYSLYGGRSLYGIGIA